MLTKSLNISINKLSVQIYKPLEDPLDPSCITQWARARGVNNDKSKGTIFTLPS